jgi:hypothetical protein
VLYRDLGFGHSGISELVQGCRLHLGRFHLCCDRWWRWGSIVRGTGVDWCRLLISIRGQKTVENLDFNF